ncbi:MAG: hypothetical protein HDR02_04625 [Lachnospiraceae bacterium]|nr:hypothetical protein [Lachnospiraceae bacterium]
MAYTKEIINNFLFTPVSKIQQETVSNNDCAELIEELNTFLILRDAIIQENKHIGELWNEICIDLLSIINSAYSGFYRTAIIGLRSVFEMGCSSLFYLDHPIEFYLFQKENNKADKYVSILVNDYSFYKTKYIKAFDEKIEEKQKEEDAISKYLQRLYGELSDVVHGRYNRLANTNDFHICYDIEQYKKFEDLYVKTISIMIIMVTLRLNVGVDDIQKYYKNTGVIKNE